MNVENASSIASENDDPAKDPVQYASGGNPGMEMTGTGTNMAVGSDTETELSPSNADFLMIQLSSFEGRADH